MHHSRGFTIIELMIGLALALLLAFAIASAYLQTKQSFRLQTAQSRISDEGNYVIGLYRRLLSQAGYRSWSGIYANAPEDTAFGADAPFAVGQSLIESNNELFVRFTGDPDGSILRCDESNDTDYPLLNVSNSKDTIYPYKLYLSNGALYCSKIDGTAARLIAANVVNYYVQYGIDNNADQVADNYVAAATVSNWKNVYATRVCIVLRSENDRLSPEAMKYLDCSGMTKTATDNRLYRTFTTTVQLRNRYK
ncbi:PilW family protein [Chitinolyticbacter albus]|uniref:PilW family protein n=1 Tax=Chitinolyticbacter albus TaxID=2961951 RepID=UPI002109C348|nr:PilW family protein [Chitinolyticbacter albus]